MSMYKKLKSMGVPLDNHESDLYALVCPESTNIINGWQFKTSVTMFTDKDRQSWYDIPFGYDPFFEK